MKLTEAEKKELDALKAKTDPTDAEKTRIATLEAKEKEDDGDQTFSKDYVESLRKENAKYRTRAKEAEEARAKFDGVDPEKYREYQAAVEAAEQDKLKSAGEWDKLRAKLVDMHTAELAKKDEAITAMQAQITQLESDLGRTVRSHEVGVEASIAEAINPKLVEMVVESQTKVEKTEDGKRKIVVLDADGQPAIDIKTGKPKTVAQLLQEMKTSSEYAHLFKGGRVGAGSGTDNFGSKSMNNPWKPEFVNLMLQGQLIKDNPDAARRYIIEAGKAPAVYGL